MDIENLSCWPKRNEWFRLTSSKTTAVEYPLRMKYILFGPNGTIIGSQKLKMQQYATQQPRKQRAFRLFLKALGHGGQVRIQGVQMNMEERRGPLQDYYPLGSAVCERTCKFGGG